MLAGGDQPGRRTGRASSWPGCPALPPLLEVRESCVARSDVVVEAATRAALVELAPSILNAGRDLVILSDRGAARSPGVDRLAAAQRGADPRPSAAIAGLDGLKAPPWTGHLDTVIMETRKPPPRVSAGAPGVAGIDLAAITAPTLVFEGTAQRACPRLSGQRERRGSRVVPGWAGSRPHLYSDPCQT